MVVVTKLSRHASYTDCFLVSVTDPTFLNVFLSDDIFLMYAVCSYEVAAETNPFKDHSPWCDFLRPNEAPVYEYMSDLKVSIFFDVSSVLFRP